MEHGLGQTAVVPEADEQAEREELERRFPGYEIKETLGRGGMGVVYRAIHLRLDRPVAIKVLSHELRSQAGFAERFEREARMLARLSHPGLVAIHDYGVAGDLCVLFLELVEGANLRELMDAGGMTPTQALDVVRQVCDALQYAHGEGVVHRDIKPENILVDSQGRVKITDFGLARLVGDVAGPRLTWTRQVMGTPHYMAPEQASSAPDVDHRADIFALGVLLYELLTGRLPVGRYKAPSETTSSDPRLDEIVMKAMEHEREQRYQDVRAVKRDLEFLARQVVDLGGDPVAGLGGSGGAGGNGKADVATGGRRRGRSASSAPDEMFGLTTFVVPTFATLGLLSMLLPWAIHQKGGDSYFLFVWKDFLSLAIAGGFLLPICVWDTFRGLMKKARTDGTPDSSSPHWASMQSLADIVGGGVALAVIALFMDSPGSGFGVGSQPEGVVTPTYLFVITISCGAVLVSVGLIRWVIAAYHFIRRFALHPRVASSMIRSIHVLGAASLLSLALPWLPANFWIYAPAGRRGYEDPMALGAFAAFAAVVVIVRGLAKASAFRIAGLTCALGAVLSFVMTQTRFIYPLWLSEAGSIVCGVAAIFLFILGLVLFVFGPSRRGE